MTSTVQGNPVVQFGKQPCMGLHILDDRHQCSALPQVAAATLSRAGRSPHCRRGKIAPTSCTSSFLSSVILCRSSELSRLAVSWKSRRARRQPGTRCSIHSRHSRSSSASSTRPGSPGACALAVHRLATRLVSSTSPQTPRVLGRSTARRKGSLRDPPRRRKRCLRRNTHRR